MPLHQDWTYIEETQNHRSYAVWIPLQDLHAENGSLEVLEGSHRSGNQWRGPGTTCPFQEHEALIREQGMLSAQYLKAGEAIVWDHRLAHASPPNLTNTPRIAVTAIITPKDKQTLHCVVSDEAKSHGHIILTDTSFYTQYTIGDIANYPRSAPFQREYAKTTLTDIKRWREKHFLGDFCFQNGRLERMKHPVFHDAALQKKFDVEGYVILDAFSEEEMKEAARYMDELYYESRTAEKHIDSDYDLSFFASSAEYKARLREKVSNYFTKFLAET